MNINELLSRWSEVQNRVLAWRYPRCDVTYGDLHIRTEERARAFEALHIDPGQTVGIASRDWSKAMELLLSVLARGAHGILIPPDAPAMAAGLGASHILSDAPAGDDTGAPATDFVHRPLDVKSSGTPVGVSVVSGGHPSRAVTLHNLSDLSAGSFAILGRGGRTFLRRAGFDPGSLVTIVLTVLSGGGTLLVEESSGIDAEHPAARMKAGVSTLCLTAPELRKVLDAGRRKNIAKADRLLCLGWHLDRPTAMRAANALGMEVHVAYPVLDLGHDAYSVVVGTSRSPKGVHRTARVSSLMATVAAGMRQCGPGEAGEIWLFASENLDKTVLGPLRSGGSILDIVRQGAAKAVRTGLIARQYRDGFVELAEAERGTTIIDGRLVDMHAIERAALTLDVVRECVVVMRYEAGEPRIVAYLGALPLDEEILAQIADFFRATLPVEMVPDYIVPLPHLPFDLHGRLDSRALVAVPVISDTIISELAREVDKECSGVPVILPIDVWPARQQRTVLELGSWAADVQSFLKSVEPASGRD